MLNAQDNQLVSQTGPGTPMGELMRRYWIPALLSWELPDPDCAPVRVKLLGEELIAFRDTDGEVGLVDNYCPHRRASLFFGRNEECGLRCVYHGWKFDVDGNCVDMPSEPAESNFKDKVRIKAYPCLDMGGAIWTYMGVPENQPPPPLFEWTQVIETHRAVNKVLQESNWLQGLEGGVDSVHASYLHNNDIANTTRYETRSAAPSIEVEPTDYGYAYGSVRHLSKEEGNFVRAYQFIMPFTQLRPDDRRESGTSPKVAGHMWVPIDDEHHFVWNFVYSLGDDPLTEADKAKHSDLAYEVIDIHNGFRCIWNAGNDYGINREVQRTQTFTGILADARVGANLQDRGIQESMGPIVDRTREHLATTDRAIIATRRMLQEAARVVGDGGSPRGTGPSYYKVRSIQRVLPVDVQWQQGLKDLLFEGAEYSPIME